MGAFTTSTGRTLLSICAIGPAAAVVHGQTLVRETRYGPWGIAFTKDFVFRKGGGPALYVLSLAGGVYQLEPGG